MLDDEVLIALCEKHPSGDDDKASEVLELKRQKLADRPGKAKAIVKDVHKWVISSLGMQRAGDNYLFFIRDTIAPLIRPGMDVYAELESDIFG